jgi:hypothetical protein
MKRPLNYDDCTLVERDAMPREVALEFLTTPGMRLTNTLRKAALDALHRTFKSNRTRKSLAVQCCNSISHRPLVRVAREKVRAERQRRGIQRKYEAALRLPESPMTELIKNTLNLRAENLDAMIDACETELRRREDITVGNVAGGILSVPEVSRFVHWVCDISESKTNQGFCWRTCSPPKCLGNATLVEWKGKC